MTLIDLPLRKIPPPSPFGSVHTYEVHTLICSYQKLRTMVKRRETHGYREVDLISFDEKDRPLQQHWWHISSGSRTALGTNYSIYLVKQAAARTHNHPQHTQTQLREEGMRQKTRSVTFLWQQHQSTSSCSASLNYLGVSSQIQTREEYFNHYVRCHVRNSVSVHYNPISQYLLFVQFRSDLIRKDSFQSNQV